MQAIQADRGSWQRQGRHWIPKFVTEQLHAALQLSAYGLCHCLRVLLRVSFQAGVCVVCRL